MKCQILFSEKNKKNIITLSSAENAQRAVKVNIMEYYGGNFRMQMFSTLQTSPAGTQR